MPVAPVAFDDAGELFNQSRAVIADEGDDIGSFHDFRSTFAGSDRILARNSLYQKEHSLNMAHFVAVPPQRLPADVLQALLEDFASRDGTDYGEREFTLDEKVERLQHQLRAGDLQILYDLDSEQWDLVLRAQAELLLDS
jgi:uncharacterized protein